MQFLVAVVDAELLEAVQLEYLKAIDVQDADMVTFLASLVDQSLNKTNYVSLISSQPTAVSSYFKYAIGCFYYPVKNAFVDALGERVPRVAGLFDSQWWLDILHTGHMKRTVDKRLFDGLLWQTEHRGEACKRMLGDSVVAYFVRGLVRTGLSV